jgi:hypothetical protein
MVTGASNPSTQEAEAKGLQVWGQSELYSETFTQNDNRRMHNAHTLYANTMPLI